MKQPDYTVHPVDPRVFVARTLACAGLLIKNPDQNGVIVESLLPNTIVSGFNTLEPDFFNNNPKPFGEYNNGSTAVSQSLRAYDQHVSGLLAFIDSVTQAIAESGVSKIQFGLFCNIASHMDFISGFHFDNMDNFKIRKTHAALSFDLHEKEPQEQTEWIAPSHLTNIQIAQARSAKKNKTDFDFACHIASTRSRDLMIMRGLSEDYYDPKTDGILHRSAPSRQSRVTLIWDQPSP